MLRSVIEGIAIALVGVAVVFGIFYSYTDSKTNSQTAQAKISDEECQKDLQCWGSKNIYMASVCQPSIEKLTRFDFKWDDGTFGSKFSHFRWHDKTANTLTFIGDKLFVQAQPDLRHP